MPTLKTKMFGSMIWSYHFIQLSHSIFVNILTSLFYLFEFNEQKIKSRRVLSFGLKYDTYY